MNRIQTLLSLAKEELYAAEILLENTLYRACISRAYYSLYHTVQALLAAKNINARTHRGLIQQFGQQFIKTGELSQKLSRTLSETFDLRQLSDYDETIPITQQQAVKTLENVKLFISDATNWLENNQIQ